jgi:hypothetical protein
MERFKGFRLQLIRCHQREGGLEKMFQKNIFDVTPAARALQKLSFLTIWNENATSIFIKRE